MANESLSACMAEIKARPGQFYVYVLSRPCGTPFYVGMGKNRRICSHHWEARHRGRSFKSTVFREAWSAGGDITHRVAGFFPSRLEAEKEEIRLIAQIGRRDLAAGPLVNLTDGGEGTFNLSPSGREKLRQSRLGRVHSEISRKKIGDAHRGKVMSAESRNKMSVARIGKAPHPATIEASRRVNTGRPLPAEHIEKLRASRAGRKLSAETRRKIAASLRGKIVSAETRRKLREANQTRKATVVAGVTYRTRKDAMRALGVGRKLLIRLMNEAGEINGRQDAGHI